MSDQAHPNELGHLAPHPNLGQYYGEDRNRPAFVRQLFDHSAGSYDRLEALVGLGSGPWYRKEALKRAGLLPGMRMLDVAIGTGLVSRAAITLLGGRQTLIGLDPSAGMLERARHKLGVTGVMGLGEQLPVRDESFDFLSMGYALRHLSDLTVTFREFLRVLKPGGIVFVLELTRPEKPLAYAALRFYLRRIVPVLSRLTTRSKESALLMSYFWDTVNACVPPPVILRALADAGFIALQRNLSLGLFSEYYGRRPGPEVSEPEGTEVKCEGDFFLRTFTHPISTLRS